MEVEEILKWMEVGFYVFVLVSVVVGTGADGISGKRKILYYGLKEMQKVNRWGRRVEVLIMEKYFEEVNG